MSRTAFTDRLRGPMAEHGAHITWERTGDEGEYLRSRYSRAHSWVFDGGASVAASSSPSVVPEPMSLAAAVDPEEAFVAAVSSCHMLFFLAFASKEGHVVDRYEDRPVGTVAPIAGGRSALTRVVLRPRVRYRGSPPDHAAEERLHERAHDFCYLARSVRTAIDVDLDPARDSTDGGGTVEFEASRTSSF